MSKYQCTTCLNIEELDIEIDLGIQDCECGGLMSQPLWISDEGDVSCEKHGGMYLMSAIKAKPKAIKHKTPLDNWSLYFTSLLGGENLKCESCTSASVKAGA